MSKIYEFYIFINDSPLYKLWLIYYHYLLYYYYLIYIVAEYSRFAESKINS